MKGGKQKLTLSFPGGGSLFDSHVVPMLFKKRDALRLCTNFKERAEDVEKLLGAKTKW